MEKSIHEFKWNLCICVWEKKYNSFKITVIILRYTEKCKSPIQKGL